MKIASVHLAIALAIGAVLPNVRATGYVLHNHLRTASNDNTSTQHPRFLGDSSCSPKGEKAVDCGAQPRDDRAEFCCPGLKCGGENGKYCVKDEDENDDGDDATPAGADKVDAEATCSPKGEKAEICGADAKPGRGKECCGGLECGGDKGKYCVKIDDDRDDDDKENDDGKDDGLSCYEAPEIEQSGDKDLGFLWHLYYEPCIKWAPRGYDFCVMCRNYKCEKNDFVVTSHCNANQEHFRWEWKEVEDGVGLMKTKSTNLCLEGDDSWDFILRPCDEDNERQHFKGFDDAPGAKFKLLPKNHQRSNTPQCMTMLHHPLAANDDDGEMIIDQPCYKAEKTETAFWTADYRPKIKEKLEKAKPTCSKEKCGECKGFCEKDSECKGDLYCYERGNKGWRTNLENGYDLNPWAQVPGCIGYGKFGKNYCSKERYKSPYSDKEIKEILDSS